jgi:hypothetical protein
MNRAGEVRRTQEGRRFTASDGRSVGTNRTSLLLHHTADRGYLEWVRKVGIGALHLLVSRRHRHRLPSVNQAGVRR